MSKEQNRVIVATLAIIYGLGVAFGQNLIDNETFWKAWLMVGAFVVGGAWLVLMVLPRGRREVESS